MAAVPYSTLRAVARTNNSPTTRQSLEQHIERMIALLDQLDGDPDLEPDEDLEPDNDNEAQGDDEPWLGWMTLDSGRTVTGGDDDREAAGGASW